MDNYLIIENMKLEALSEFKSIWPKKRYWSNFVVAKIRVVVKDSEYQKLIQLQNMRDIKYTLKHKSKFYGGTFDLTSILGISKFNSGQVIQVTVSKLEVAQVSKNTIRDLLLSELLEQK